MLSPLTASRWDFDAAAHLLVRAGFGGPPEEIQKIFALGPEKAVDSLINAPPENDLPPAWATPNDQDELRAENAGSCDLARKANGTQAPSGKIQR
jgi:hypothetical protein